MSIIAGIQIQWPKNRANFKPFFTNEHRTWQETEPLLAGRVYPLAYYINQKADETVNAITLLDATTDSEHDTYSNLYTTIAYLTTKLSL